MSYLRKFEYKIVPEGSFKIIRNCAGCGCKTIFTNTNNFRVNANGNKVDVWLIYQCEKCKHTYNLSIYDRNRPHSIDENEYKAFMDNSEDLALNYGRKTSLFISNKAEIDWKHMKYSVRKLHDLENGKLQKGDLLVIDNSSKLKVRYDKVLSDILKVTRSKLKKLEKENVINIIEKRQEHKVEIQLLEDIKEAVY